MTAPDTDQTYLEQLVQDYCGDRIATFPQERKTAISDMFGDVLWQEGIEALTTARVDSIIEYTACHLPKAA